MKTHLIITTLVLFSFSLLYGQEKNHTWQKVEIELQADNEYENPYADVDVWVQLRGPGFSKRCYGFWDGDSTWRIRLMATSPGSWTWTSGSNQDDRGLNGKKGVFEAMEWTEAHRPHTKGV